MVSAALGVNKLDQVVGYSYLPAGPGIPGSSKWHLRVEA